MTCLETKLDDLDVVNIDNYDCVRKDRKQKVIRRSGGIAVLVNKHIARYFEYIDSDGEYVLWFKLSKVLLNTDEDIYIGAVYLPPINSNYCQDRILNMFNDELETFSRSHKYVTLLGDFNARTGSLTDITIPDDEMLHQIGVILVQNQSTQWTLQIN